jgi:predicted TIM-barrel fold metal-dependent hydrolase
MEEEILEPELRICDAHHHLWDRRESEPRRYLLDELLNDIASGHRVESTVYVEAGTFYSATKPVALRPVGEVEFAAGIAAMAESGKFGPVRACAAIVGHANLELGAAVSEVLAALKTAAGGRLAGIRHMAPWDASPTIPSVYTNPVRHLYGHDHFRAGFAQLAAFDLSFDAFQWHTQLSDVASLARAFPETRIALNHVGSPIGIGPYAGKRDEVYFDWLKGIREVAACPNVVVKLGGLGLRATGFGFHERADPVGSEEIANAWSPYIKTCIDTFGPGRAMFESNFPVDKVSCGYGTLWNVFKRIAAGYSADEKALMFKDNAERFYRCAPSDASSSL